jgi:hypothetical protein
LSGAAPTASRRGAPVLISAVTALPIRCPVGSPRARPVPRAARIRRLFGRKLSLARLPEARGRRYAPDAADLDALKMVRLQDDVERLVPRHVDETQGDATFHVVGDDDVLASDLGQHAEHVHDVGVLEVERDLLARVNPSFRRARLGLVEASFGLG